MSIKTNKQINKNLLNCIMSWTLPDTGLRKGGGSPRRSSFHFIYPWLEPIWHHVIEKRLDFTHHRQGSCWTREPRTSVSFWQYLDSFCHTVVRSITIFKIKSTVQLGALHVSFRTTPWFLQIAFEGDFWCSCTVTFWQNVDFIITRCIILKWMKLNGS